MKITVGIDIGSRTSKIVFLGEEGIIYHEIIDSGLYPKKSAQKLLDSGLAHLNIPREKITSIFATGYGRNVVDFADRKISEISCHAKGVHYYFPDAHTVIDIGGQDSKAILLGKEGRVTDFVMNDKCAAGTGRFLEVAATILGISVDELGPEALKSDSELVIDNTCVVFAESEIIGLISRNYHIPEIAHAVHHSIARRTRGMLSSIHWRKPIVFTGGVAKNIGMKTALENIMESDVFVPENSFITGALGAAIIAR